MMTVELTDVLAAIPSNNESNPNLLCVRNGVLSYRPFVTNLPSGTNLNNITNTGTYRLDSGCTPAPTGFVTLGAILQHWTWDSNRMFQEIRNLQGVYCRNYDVGQWSGWSKFAYSTS